MAKTDGKPAGGKPTGVKSDDNSAGSHKPAYHLKPADHHKPADHLKPADRLKPDWSDNWVARGYEA